MGRDDPVQVDVRMVAATNRDLRELVAQGEFREDLFYRLAVVELTVPALRHRREDIAPLARHFVAAASAGRAMEIPDEVASALEAREWPGNVRELENACERMAILATGDRVRLDDLGQGAGQPPSAHAALRPCPASLATQIGNGGWGGMNAKCGVFLNWATSRGSCVAARDDEWLHGSHLSSGVLQGFGFR